MKLPKQFKPTLERLVGQLHDLLPEEARPRSLENSSAFSGAIKTSPNALILISEAQMSKDEEIHRVQRFYNMAWLTLNEVLPGIELIDSEKQLKEHFFQKKEAIFQQLSHILLDRIRREIPKSNYAPSTTSESIPQDQLIEISPGTEEKELHTLFMQLSYNITYVSALEIPQQKQCKSPKELGWHYLNQSQRIVNQLTLPVLNYICDFLPSTDKPLNLGETIPNEKLSSDLEVQFFQRLYNIVCLLSNVIFPNLQGKCHSVDDLIPNLVNPIVDMTIHSQVTPFLDRSLHYFIDELYKLLPVEGRPKIVGEIIGIQQLETHSFKKNNDLQFIVSIYNVACQIKNSILLRIKKIDSTSISRLFKLSKGFSPGNVFAFLSEAKELVGFLGEIKPLLEHLRPIFNQMKVFFIHDLYEKLSSDHRPSQCGELISDDNLSKTDPNIFFIQKCYNLACFLLNELIPGIEDCATSVGILIFLGGQSKNFRKHFSFIDELMRFDSARLPTISTKISDFSTIATTVKVTKDQSKVLLSEIEEPFLKQIEKFLGSIPNITNNLIFFVSFLLKETVKFTNLSIKLTHSLNAPFVTGNLSYYAACHINEAIQTLNDLLQEDVDDLYYSDTPSPLPLSQRERGKEDAAGLKERENYWLLRSHLINSYKFVNVCFGSNRDTHVSDIDDMEKTLQAWGITSVNANQKPPFVPEEVKEITTESDKLVDQGWSLLQALFTFSNYRLTPANCENSDVTLMFDNIQKQYEAFHNAIQFFSQHLSDLHETKFISFTSSGNTVFHNYSEFSKTLSRCREQLDTFTKSINDKIETRQQLQKNNLYIKTVYNSLSTSFIKPAKNFLEKEKPTSYQFSYHQKINTLLLALKKETFSEPTIHSLPHPEINKEDYSVKIGIFHRNFHTERKELISKLEKDLTHQKNHFKDRLKNSIEQALSDLSVEITANSNILTALFQKIGEASGETTYRETLKAIEDRLTTLTLDHLISEILQDQPLENTELVKPWVAEFSNSEGPGIFAIQIKESTTPLIQIIENQRVQLNATNQKEIEQLQNEIKELGKKIVAYSDSYPNILREIETLKEKQQQEKESLWEKHEKPNEIIHGLVEKVNAYAAMLHLSPILANTNWDLSPEIDGLFEAIEAKLTSLDINLPSPKSLSSSPSSKLSTLSSLSPSSASSKTRSFSSSSSASSTSSTSDSNGTFSNGILDLPNSPPPLPSNSPKKSKKEILETLNDRAQTAKDFETILKILETIENDVSKKEILMLTGIIEGLKNAESGADAYKKEHSLLVTKKSVAQLAGLESPIGKEQALLDRETIQQKTEEACRVLGGILGDLTTRISQQADAATKAMDDLDTQHKTSLEAAYQKLYDGILKEKHPANPEAYLEALKKEQTIKQLKFDLAQLKKCFHENDAALKTIKTTSNAITVPNVIFEQTEAFTFEQWVIHYHSKTQQLDETQTTLATLQETFSKSQTELKTLQEKTIALGEQIALLWQDGSRPNIQIKALSSLKETMQKQGETLSKEYTEIEKTRIQKTQALETKRQTLSEEEKQAKEFNQRLVAVGSIKGQINVRLQQVKTRSHGYDRLVSQILEDTLKNPRCILEEDQFYQDISQSIMKLKSQLDALAIKKIQKATPLSVLETAFNKALETKIKDAQNQITVLETSHAAKKQAWKLFLNQTVLLRHSREIANAPRDIGEELTQCEDRFLDRIQLTDRNFQGVSIKNSRFRHAQLTRCDFSGLALDRVDFRGADIHSCRFQNANFKGVLFDDKTQLDWKTHGKQILLDNLVDPSHGLPTDYLSNLTKLVKIKCQGKISGDWILDALKAIAKVKQPDNVDEKDHLSAQQNRAVFMVTQLVPALDSLDKILSLKALVENEMKHKGDENPYGFIRRELDLFRCKYGNTRPWEQIMTCIKNRLNEVAQDVKLEREEYEAGKMIMETHVTHDYGFGFFYTPQVAHEWEINHIPLSLWERGRGEGLSR